jgi:hypothetical protein
VPVRAIGWIQPEQANALLLPDGYVLSVSDSHLGRLTIEGCRSCSAPAPSEGLTWHEGDVTYTLRTASDPGLVTTRIVPLGVARKQLTGSTWDVPVLYAWYLPAFAAFSIWSVWSTLFQPTRP